MLIAALLQPFYDDAQVVVSLRLDGARETIDRVNRILQVICADVKKRGCPDMVDTCKRLWVLKRKLTRRMAAAAPPLTQSELDSEISRLAGRRGQVAPPRPVVRDLSKDRGLSMVRTPAVQGETPVVKQVRVRSAVQGETPAVKQVRVRFQDDNDCPEEQRPITRGGKKENYCQHLKTHPYFGKTPNEYGCCYGEKIQHPPP